MQDVSGNAACPYHATAAKSNSRFVAASCNRAWVQPVAPKHSSPPLEQQAHLLKRPQRRAQPRTIRVSTSGGQRISEYCCIRDSESGRRPCGGDRCLWSDRLHLLCLRLKDVEWLSMLTVWRERRRAAVPLAARSMRVLQGHLRLCSRQFRKFSIYRIIARPITSDIGNHWRTGRRWVR